MEGVIFKGTFQVYSRGNNWIKQTWKRKGYHIYCTFPRIIGWRLPCLSPLSLVAAAALLLGALLTARPPNSSIIQCL
jgi:hypothetical protein